jgi:hypothetical protein
MNSKESAGKAFGDFESLLDEVAKASGGVVVGASITPRADPSASAGYDPQEYPWLVWVSDNFLAPGDDDYDWDLARYKSAAEAVAAAERVVDRFLEANLENGMSADELYKNWSMHGYRPHVHPDPGERFDASKYCERLVAALCVKWPANALSGITRRGPGSNQPE